MMLGRQIARTATTDTLLMPARLTDIMVLTGLRGESSLALARGGAGVARGEVGVLAVASASGADSWVAVASLVGADLRAAVASWAGADLRADVASPADVDLRTVRRVGSTAVVVASTVVVVASTVVVVASTVVVVASTVVAVDMAAAVGTGNGHCSGASIQY
jgi:hypothetical protein